jgi:hypothetical protein
LAGEEEPALQKINSLRIKSASFAITPFVDLGYRSIAANDLINVQAVVAYFYASLRHTFGDLFLTSEHASMAIFTPGQVLATLVQPDFHVEAEESRVFVGRR